MRLLIVTLATALSVLAHEASAQTYIKPYTSGSAADKIIRFDNGASGRVTAPSPAYTVGLGYSSAPASGSGGGWNIRTSGTVTMGVGLPPLDVITGKSSAFTEVNSSQTLIFGVSTSGLSNLVGASLPMTWLSSATVTGSELWVPETTNFRYTFDVLLNNSLVSGNPSLFGAINLTIKSGSTTLYNVTGLSNILGITSITSSNYLGVNVDFNYSPATGPLSIEWSASTTVNAALLNLLGNSESIIYRVQNPSVSFQAIPEPSSVALIGLSAAGVLGIMIRRRF